MKLFQFVDKSTTIKAFNYSCVDVYLDVLKYKKYTFLNISIFDNRGSNILTIRFSADMFEGCLFSFQLHIFGITTTVSLLSWTYIT